MSLATRRGLYGKLAGDTTLNALLAAPPAGRAKNIWFGYAAPEARFPYLVFSKQSGAPTDTLARTAFDEDVWMVKGVDRGSTGDVADQIADRVRALLQDATLSISGANHKFLRRMSDIDYPETTDGQRYWHAGTLWRLVTEPT